MRITASEYGEGHGEATGDDRCRGVYFEAGSRQWSSSKDESSAIARDSSYMPQESPPGNNKQQPLRELGSPSDDQTERDLVAVKASYYSSIASARNYAAAAEREFTRRGLTARRTAKSPPRQLEYFSPRQLRKDRPKRPTLAVREAEEAAASQSNLARSIAFHLHTSPPTFFTGVVAEEALMAERTKLEKAEAEEEAVHLREATEAACQALTALLIECVHYSPIPFRLPRAPF